MKDNRIVTIIIRQLTGQANAEDQEALQNWEQQAPENRKESEAVRRAWEWSGSYDAELKPDVDAGLNRLKARMAKDRKASKPSAPPTAKRVALSFPRAILRLAVAAAIVFSIGFVARNYLQPSSKAFIVSTTAGQQEKIELTDGSVVWLNENSQLEFSNPNNRTERRAKLTGEAFFEVQKNPNKPFVIDTDNSEVKVLGTSFNVRAIPDEGFTEVQVRSGKVAFQSKSTQEKLVLKEADKGMLMHQSSEMKKETDPTLNALSWHSKKLHFNNTSLRKVLSDLERYYQVNLELTNADMYSCEYTSPFPGTELIVTLRAIKDFYGMDLERVNSSNYRLKGGTCSKD